MTLLKEPDLGTPERPGPATVELEIDGQAVSVPAGTSVMRAAALAGVDVPKLCATDSLEAVRLLPALPRRGRGRQGHAGLVHAAVLRRHEGHDAEREARRGSAAT